MPRVILSLLIVCLPALVLAEQPIKLRDSNSIVLNLPTTIRPDTPVMIGVDNLPIDVAKKSQIFILPEGARLVPFQTLDGKLVLNFSAPEGKYFLVIATPASDGVGKNGGRALGRCTHARTAAAGSARSKAGRRQRSKNPCRLADAGRRAPIAYRTGTDTRANRR